MDRPSAPLRLGTRASPLAMAQAELVRAALLAAHGWDAGAIEIVSVVASGDRVQDRALADIGGKALWTRELDQWLRAGEIDFAVHSMKDVETIRPDDFAIAAMLPRADVRDRLLGVASFADIPSGAKVGTSAPRRTAQLRAMRPDLEIVLFRGNVNTRLAKLAAGEVAATLLAAAGLDRLGMHDFGVPVPVDVMLPAPSQAAIGVECRASDQMMRAMLDAIDDRQTHQCVGAERGVLAALRADCRSPVAALAECEGRQIFLRAEIWSEDGAEHVAGHARFDLSDADGPARLAHELLDGASPALRASFG